MKTPGLILKGHTAGARERPMGDGGPAWSAELGEGLESRSIVEWQAEVLPASEKALNWGSPVNTDENAASLSR